MKNLLIRAAMPQNVHAQLKHLAVDLRRPMRDMIVDAVLLLLKQHGRNVPDPDSPPLGSQASTRKGGAR